MSPLKQKTADVAGMFYPADPQTLRNQILAFQNFSLPLCSCESRAVIIPHAGYVYSGQLAASALQYLDKNAANIFIFAPAHRIPLEGIAVCDYDAFETPLGTLAVNCEICDRLRKDFGCKLSSEAFSGEHAVEVQLPMLQMHLPGAKIIPLVVGDTAHSTVCEILEKFWEDRKNAFIISSDLSHFHSCEEAAEIDSTTCNMIENCATEDFSFDRACGATAIRGLMDFTAKKGFSLQRVGTHNSGDTSGDRNRVVGYGAWILSEVGMNKFIKNYFSDEVISICHGSIESALRGEDFTPPNIRPPLEQLGASFVTLKIHGDLRGCIGSIRAYQPLISDLIQNARSAAFRDSRFSPLTGEEFANIDIHVSLLSHPRKIAFKCEKDLLDAITPNLDGIIIRDGIFQAVYLPSVWEQLPDKNEFLASLKLKAGLPRNHFSGTLEAFKFSCENI
ncbi:MAG: AmmeMemoRadiSam system protein B [Puniceicoccales bacterium]|jgi:AmmeMemoRadiSam system protein B/AmmeMemoRadiSam system protein A|nr:AmmeMemoRadiSam system protein B [Puniceicoccales bacterium]